MKLHDMKYSRTLPVTLLGILYHRNLVSLRNCEGL